MTKTIYYFGESVRFSPTEKEEAMQYLRSWKKFLLSKLRRDVYSMKVIDEQNYHRDAHLVGVLCQYEEAAIKLAVEVEMKFEVEPFAIDGDLNTPRYAKEV